MKKLLLSLSLLTFLMILPSSVFAQGMMGFPGSSSDSTTIQNQQQEEQAGKKFLDNLNNKTITCSQLKDADFEKIGEYFMGQSIGDTSRHIAMNEMMKSMMGEQGEERVHIAWGKRGSGCNTSAAFQSGDIGFMPMMQMMMGGGGNSMMGGWNGLGVFEWLPMILFWLILILGVVVLIRYLSLSGQSKDKTPLDILKERYACGEINKKEFEEKKKDL